MGLPKQKLKEILSRVLQLVRKNNGQVPPPPPEPTHQERKVVMEFQEEQRKIEFEHTKKEVTETDNSLVGNPDNY